MSEPSASAITSYAVAQQRAQNAGCRRGRGRWPKQKGEEMKDTDWSLLAQRAWGRALVKTGIEHLDPGMVRQGKRTLQEAETGVR